MDKKVCSVFGFEDDYSWVKSIAYKFNNLCSAERRNRFISVADGLQLAGVVFCLVQSYHVGFSFSPRLLKEIITALLCLI
jgi:hypothetical protein